MSTYFWAVLYDGADSFEKFGSTCDFGLYRDDGLGISKASSRQTELIKEDLCSIFSNYGLKITIEANKKTVNLLDVTLNMSNGKLTWLTPNQLFKSKFHTQATVQIQIQIPRTQVRL